MEGTGLEVQILLLSEVTLFEYNVSTILSPIVGFYMLAAIDQCRRHDRYK